MTRMTGPDCAVICNLINTHTHTHSHINWSMLVPEKAAPVTIIELYLEDYWSPYDGERSAVNAIGTQV